MKQNKIRKQTLAKQLCLSAALQIFMKLTRICKRNREKRALLKQIEPLLKETDTDIENIEKHFEIESFEEATPSVLQEVLRMLTKKKNKMQAEAQEKIGNNQEEAQSSIIKKAETTEHEKIKNTPNEQPQDKSKSSNTSNELIQDSKSKKPKENRVKEAPPINKEIDNDMQIRLQKIRNNVKRQAKEQVEYSGYNDEDFANTPRLFE